MLRLFTRRLYSSSISTEPTLNGYGVTMSTPEKDPFVRQWIRDTMAKLKLKQQQHQNSSDNEDYTDDAEETNVLSSSSVSALEVGCGFGAASIELFRQACELTKKRNEKYSSSLSSSSSCSLHIVANDMDQRNLKKTMSRFDKFMTEKRNKFEREELQKSPHQLRSWLGRVPEIFDEQREEDSTTVTKTTTPSKFDTICVANVLHFLTDEEVHRTLSLLFENYAIPGSKIYISMNSPFSKAALASFPSPTKGVPRKSSLTKNSSDKRPKKNHNVMIPENLERFVEEAGWEIVETDGARLMMSGNDQKEQGDDLGVVIPKEMVGVVAMKKKR